jgi:2-hydroxychromene-2-carboxylate isomerase
MSHPIHFYFDFSSPYGYLAAEQIEALGKRANREVIWHPILLGVIFKATGGQPLTMAPMKGDYSLNDFKRSAAFYGLSYNAPTVFPIASQNTCRAVLWAQKQDHEKAKQLALAFYRGFFVQDRDIGKLDVIADIAKAQGFDPDALVAAIQTDEIKNELKANVEAAIALKVFGSPFFIVDGEQFWGADRLPMLEKWVMQGGWKY